MKSCSKVRVALRKAKPSVNITFYLSLVLGVPAAGFPVQDRHQVPVGPVIDRPYSLACNKFKADGGLTYAKPPGDLNKPPHQL
jgi:hypothetical protein